MAIDLAAQQVTATVLDGKAMAGLLKAETARDMAALRTLGVQPGLAVALVGEDPASNVYVTSKVKACSDLGIRSTMEHLPASTTQAELLALVARWNADPEIDGILVQLPLPKGIDVNAVVDAVHPSKDVDGFHPHNLGLLVSGRPGLVACTPAGIMKMLTIYGNSTGWTPAGKRAVVLGRSITVGKPMAALLTNAHATVTVCHSRTPDLAGRVAEADLVIAAVGSPKLVQGGWIKRGAVVVDVGIHRGADGKLCGDVDFDSARLVAAALSPVPGGVGPMTIAQLMRNTVNACIARRGLSLPAAT